MKSLITILCILCSATLFAQTFPAFVEGTWKMEGQDNYETWRYQGADHVEGEGYQLKNGEKNVLEEVEIKWKNGAYVYTARVFGQNDNKPIDFKLTSSDDTSFTAENPAHDFPQKIHYVLKDNETIYVHVSGGGRQFAFQMHRVND